MRTSHDFKAHLDAAAHISHEHQGLNCFAKSVFGTAWVRFFMCFSLVVSVYKALIASDLVALFLQNKAASLVPNR